MALTNDPELASRMQRYRSHGITSTPDEMVARPDNEIWNYQQITLGYNYRMTDIHAALGISQMQRIDEFVSKRHAIAERYNELLAGLPLTTPWQHPYGYSGWHLYVIRLKLDEIRKTHKDVYESLRKQGIGVNLHYIPVYRQPFYEKMGFKVGYCAEAEQYFQEVVSIPVYPGLTIELQGQVVEAIRKALEI